LKKINKKYFITILLITAALFVASNSFAAKKSKWQAMLERNSVPIIYWQKYLPKVSRTEYRKAVKNYQGSQSLPQDQNNSEADTDVIDGKYPLPASSGKIAREQHLWLKSGQSASSHYEMTNTPDSCKNGMAGGFGAFGPLEKKDKEEEKYYVNMRWGYADWIEPESKLDGKLGKSDKFLLLKSAGNFPKSGYVKIENEYIKYSSKSGNKLKGLGRGYKSSAGNHEDGDNVKLGYKYKGGKWENVTRALNLDKDKKEWYKKKKVLVTNERNGKKVVTSILESGPAIWTDRVGGLSPEAFEFISAKNNEDCTFQYVDGDTKLGKVD
jgi:hypothetical protein